MLKIKRDYEDKVNFKEGYGLKLSFLLEFVLANKWLIFTSIIAGILFSLYLTARSAFGYQIEFKFKLPQRAAEYSYLHENFLDPLSATNSINKKISQLQIVGDCDLEAILSQKGIRADYVNEKNGVVKFSFQQPSEHFVMSCINSITEVFKAETAEYIAAYSNSLKSRLRVVNERLEIMKKILALINEGRQNLGAKITEVYQIIFSLQDEKADLERRLLLTRSFFLEDTIVIKKISTSRLILKGIAVGVFFGFLLGLFMAFARGYIGALRNDKNIRS